MKGILRLRSQKGASMVYPVILVMGMVIIMAGMLEYFRMQIIAQGVRESVKAAVLAVASDNSEDLFGGTREGYSGAYELAGEDWKGTLSGGDVYGELDSMLGLTNQGEEHVRTENGEVSYSISGLDVAIQNAPFAGGTNAQQFQVEASILLTVPLRFAGKVLPPMTGRLNVSSGFICKF